MRILVTGGAGFIGSHLCDRLLGMGHEVICIDNFFTGKKEHVARLQDHGSFQLIEHDIITPLFLEQHIDQIYNLACPASPVHYQYNPVRTIKANTVGVINILGLARAHGARFLQASTSEVYGDPEIHPQHESYRGNVNPIGPRACYDEGKRCAETLCFDYHRMHGIDIKVVRIFNTYGPRMSIDDGRVVTNFISQAIRGESITIYGDGLQTRSFCYVDDLVIGLIAMMESNAAETGPINLGNPVEITIRDLAERIIRLTGSSSEIICTSLPVDDPKRRKPDITRAQEILSWNPTWSLDDGLIRTIKNIREQVESTHE